MKTHDGRRVVIPNAHLFTEKMVVDTAYDARRLEDDVAIGCGEGERVGTERRRPPRERRKEAS